MQSFLVKLGKVINALKRDGFWNGLRKTAGYLGVYLQNIFVFKSGDVLFITSGVGDSARFRAQNVAEELRGHGFKCAVISKDSPFLWRCTNRFEIFIFQKIGFSLKIEKMVENIKKQRKEIIFDTDDLLFDLEYFKLSDYYNHINLLEKRAYVNGVGGEFVSDPYVKICTTTTTYLAEKLRERGKKVIISKNKLSNHDLKIMKNIQNTCFAGRRAKYKISDTKIKIGYFSGTISHNKDFATITDALLRTMEKYSQVRLFLAGPLDIENKLNKFRERIEQVPFASRKQHFENIAKVDINLAPLEMGNPFCEAKSELKFFEAGIVAVPTVAVKNQTFSEAIVDGQDGFLAGNTDEWADKLEKLILDENLRREMGQRAREKALAEYTNKNSHNEVYYAYLRNKLRK